MLKRICDRCKKEINGNYWTIDIYEKSEGAISNIQTNIRKMFNSENEYCKECIEEIEKVMINK